MSANSSIQYLGGVRVVAGTPTGDLYMSHPATFIAQLGNPGECTRPLATIRGQLRVDNMGRLDPDDPDLARTLSILGITLGQTYIHQTPKEAVIYVCTTEF